MGIIGRIIGALSKGPAIQNLENVDMVVSMKDGGILMPIVCSKHLDGSDEIFNLVKTKIENYINTIDLPAFKQEYQNPLYIQIEMNCVKKPDQRILNELDLLNERFSGKQIRFSWKS